jgi:hypothetical protein
LRAGEERVENRKVARFSLKHLGDAENDLWEPTVKGWRRKARNEERESVVKETQEFLES